MSVRIGVIRGNGIGPEVFGEDWQVKEGSGSIVFDKENVSLR